LAGLPHVPTLPHLGRIVPWVIAGLITVFIGASIGLLLGSSDGIVPGVRVMGLDLGGRSPADARSLVASEAASFLQRPVTLKAGGHEWEMPADQLGISIDADAVVADAFAVGHDGNIVQRVFGRWGAVFLGSRLTEPLLQIDSDEMESELQAIADEVERPTQDARIDLIPSGDDYSVAIVGEQPGTRILVAETAERVRKAVAAGLPATITLAMETTEPSITTADLQSARTQAQRILSQPLTFTLDDKRWTVSRAEIAQTLEFEGGDGQPVQASVNVAPLQRRFEQLAREVGRPAQDARFTFSGGVLRVLRESQDGRRLDVEALSTQVHDRLLSTGDRTLPLPVVVAQPRVSSADASKLGIREVIKEGRTAFAGSVPEKQHNIGLAASRLNGVVVPPGGLFSFNHEVGPTTLEAGFQSGWGITMSASGARTIPSVAGGICQVATTLFQPVFHSGYQIEERHYHLYWINSYGQPPLGMKGLDATVDEEAGLDFQFINNSENYMLIQSWVDGTTLVFGLYGTKPAWDVKVDGPVINNTVPADTRQVEQAEPTMPVGKRLAVESAQDGFDATITRTVKQGDSVRTLPLKSHYVPSRNVILYGTGST